MTEQLDVYLDGGPATGQRHSLSIDAFVDTIRVAVPQRPTYRPADETVLPVEPGPRIALYHLNDGDRRFLAYLATLTPAERMQRFVDSIRVTASFRKIDGEPDPPRHTVVLTGGPWDGRTVDLGKPPHLVALYAAHLEPGRIAWYAPRWRWRPGLTSPPVPAGWDYIGTETRPWDMPVPGSWAR